MDVIDIANRLNRNEVNRQISMLLLRKYIVSPTEETGKELFRVLLDIDNIKYDNQLNNQLDHFLDGLNQLMIKYEHRINNLMERIDR